MSETQKIICPECKEGVDRRDFMASVGGQAATLLAVGGGLSAAPRVLAQAPGAAAPPQSKPAEAMIRELFNGLSNEQKAQLVFAWDHRANGSQTPTRLRMFNAAFARRIGDAYTRPQQELVERILKSICNGEEGWRLISRAGTWDGSQTFGGCGAYIFGDPTTQQWAWVFMGHHLTVRCDGNSVPDTAFGGPMYYGHSPFGYSQRNLFYYQTRSALAVFDSLTEAQRRLAVVTGNPGEQEGSVRFRAGPYPGIPASELTADQRRLVEAVMRDVLSPYRREDADEVMQIVRRNGGLERLCMGFFRDRENDDSNQWHFWRIEGPGFVWNFRVLPHVHTFVNISSRF